MQVNPNSLSEAVIDTARKYLDEAVRKHLTTVFNEQILPNILEEIRASLQANVSQSFGALGYDVHITLHMKEK